MNEKQLRENIATCLLNVASALTTEAYRLMEENPTIDVDLQHVGYSDEQLGREK